jgi:hypothetical protein
MFVEFYVLFSFMKALSPLLSTFMVRIVCEILASLLLCIFIIDNVICLLYLNKQSRPPRHLHDVYRTFLTTSVHVYVH